jgi:DNA-directed RNA polymerase specialized sigma24 family protein|uniref:DNA-directed RNA polymerase specialized sigma subunit n=1 Tax=Siphoviridae sp. ctOCb13 TaxID=2825477 RepID=A0A8S5Q187_9CAUD|nr:MAG TPA: DNA-directed RNA polymerase specialized sigma subunit [Siphoviridae sp. ctOCb13]
MLPNASKEPGKPTKSTAKCRQLSPKEKERLFNKYVMPNLKDIKSLTKHYTDNYQDVDDNYNYCLAQLYNYIGSYNPEQKLMTWLHIVVKRACFHQNKKRYEEAQHWTDIEMCSMDDLYQHGNSMIVEAGFGNLIDNISDQMLAALMKIPPQRLSPFMMYVQGHKIREITAAEWKLGHLEKRSEDIVKSRIYWAKRELQYILRQYGITRKNRKSPADDRDCCEEDD